ncbi:MAG: LapA family protein [Lachnospiraceae bacterium]|nr:LapA family protein [Lachnospiraceae bacterium]
MDSIKKLKLTKRTCLFAAIQLLILSAALLGWRIHRKNLFVQNFSIDEYIVSENAVRTENVLTDETINGGGEFIRTPGISLKRGTYTIYVNYNTNAEDSAAYARSSQLGVMEMHCPDTDLNPACRTAELSLDLSRGVTDLTVGVSFSGRGTLVISDIYIIENTDYYKRNIIRAFALCLLLNFLCLFKKSGTSSRKVIFALAVIFAATCYPLFLESLPVGHDIPFHLLRIEGIAKGLQNHVFPVKIQPFWAKDYGYAVGVMYGNAFLYFPAILRRFGYSVQAAYKLYAAAVNLGTVIISYFTFKRIFRSKRIGLLGCLIYSLSIYRLIDVYTRASVGEYTAMMFFPMVLCGFYLIFTEASRENLFKPSVLTALGLTGLIQSHVLSCEMAALVILLVCLILVKRVFRRHVFAALASAAGLTLLLNLGFLVPFLDYYGSNLNITSEQWTGSTIGFFQNNGLIPVQLFTLFGYATGGSWQVQAGVYNEVTITMGISFLLGILLFLYMLLCHFKECRALRTFVPACVCTLLGCLLLYMSTCYFPWDAIASVGDAAKDLIYKLEFPWRLLAPATALLTCTCCFSVSALCDICKDKTAHAVTLALLALLLVNSGWYLYDFTFTGEPYHAYAPYELNSMQMYSYDFLPEGTNPEEIRDNLILTEAVADMSFYEKQGTKILCSVATENLEGYIDFPLNYYKYYVCTDTATGEHLNVSPGYNNMVRVTLPANYSGSISVRFQEPFHWRLSEILSLLTFLGLGCFWLYRRYRPARQPKEA